MLILPSKGISIGCSNLNNCFGIVKEINVVLQIFFECTKKSQKCQKVSKNIKNVKNVKNVKNPIRQITIHVHGLLLLKYWFTKFESTDFTI